MDMKNIERQISAPPPEDSSSKLKRELGLLDGVAIIISAIIGCGIFITPTGVVEYSGSIGLSLIIWCLCGILALTGALCFAELGTLFPKSGGDYVYMKEAFGPLVGFLYVWSRLFIVAPADSAIRCLLFALYTIRAFTNRIDDTTAIEVKLGAIFICFVATFINCFNIKLVARVQIIFSIAKLLALISIVGGGIVYLFMGHTENIHDVFSGGIYDPGSITLAFYSGFYAYAGWNSLNFVTEELKEPNKNLPRTIYISLPLITIIYTLTNFSYFVVLTRNEMISSHAVAETFGERVFKSVAFIIPLFVACSAFGAINSTLLSTSRLILAAAQDGHLPKILAKVSEKSSAPVPALLFLTFVTLCAFAVDNINDLVIYSSFIESLFQSFCIFGQILIRYRNDPEVKNRAIKVNILLPYAFFFFITVFFLISCYTSPFSILVSSAILFVGLIVYYLKHNRFVLWLVGYLEKYYHTVPINETG